MRVLIIETSRKVFVHPLNGLMQNDFKIIDSFGGSKPKLTRFSQIGHRGIKRYFEDQGFSRSLFLSPYLLYLSISLAWNSPRVKNKNSMYFENYQTFVENSFNFTKQRNLETLIKAWLMAVTMIYITNLPGKEILEIHVQIERE